MAKQTKSKKKESAIRYDNDKPPIGLFPSKAVIETAKVFGFGAKKYAAHNWRKGMTWSRAYNSLQRHLLAWNDGIDLDPETGLSHLAHAMCNLCFLIEYNSTHKKLDDRWQK